MASNQRARKGLFGRAVAGASDRMFDIVDPDMVLDHVDVNALLDRVDVNALLDRVDIDALLGRADIDALMDRIDIRAIVERAGIPEIVAESTSHLGGSALDLFRRPVVGLDEILFRVINGLFGREPDKFPDGPGELVTWVEGRTEVTEGIKTGRYAGVITRMFAVMADFFFVTAAFTVIAAGITFLIQFFIPDFEFDVSTGLIYGAALVVWAFLYLWVGWSVFGKTLGKMLLGVRVVRYDGSVTIQARHAFVRALTYPLSFALFGVGLLGAIFGQERRTWHDHFAGTAVVYDWGSRTAAMPTPLAEYLKRKALEP